MAAAREGRKPEKHGSVAVGTGTEKNIYGIIQAWQRKRKAYLPPWHENIQKEKLWHNEEEKAATDMAVLLHV